MRDPNHNAAINPQVLPTLAPNSIPHFYDITYTSEIPFVIEDKVLATTYGIGSIMVENPEKDNQWNTGKQRYPKFLYDLNGRYNYSPGMEELRLFYEHKMYQDHSIAPSILKDKEIYFDKTVKSLYEKLKDSNQTLYTNRVNANYKSRLEENYAQGRIPSLMVTKKGDEFPSKAEFEILLREISSLFMPQLFNLTVMPISGLNCDILTVIDRRYQDIVPVYINMMYAVSLYHQLVYPADVGLGVASVGSPITIICNSNLGFPVICAERYLRSHPFDNPKHFEYEIYDHNTFTDSNLKLYLGEIPKNLTKRTSQISGFPWTAHNSIICLDAMTPKDYRLIPEEDRVEPTLHLLKTTVTVIKRMEILDTDKSGRPVHGDPTTETLQGRVPVKKRAGFTVTASISVLNKYHKWLECTYEVYGGDIVEVYTTNEVLDALFRNDAYNSERDGVNVPESLRKNILHTYRGLLRNNYVIGGLTIPSTGDTYVKLHHTDFRLYRSSVGYDPMINGLTLDENIVFYTGSNKSCMLMINSPREYSPYSYEDATDIVYYQNPGGVGNDFHEDAGKSTGRIYARPRNEKDLFNIMIQNNIAIRRIHNPSPHIQTHLFYKVGEIPVELHDDLWVKGFKNFISICTNQIFESSGYPVAASMHKQYKYNGKLHHGFRGLVNLFVDEYLTFIDAVSDITSDSSSNYRSYDLRSATIFSSAITKYLDKVSVPTLTSLMPYYLQNLNVMNAKLAELLGLDGWILTGSNKYQKGSNVISKMFKAVMCVYSDILIDVVEVTTVDNVQSTELMPNVVLDFLVNSYLHTPMTVKIYDCTMDDIKRLLRQFTRAFGEVDTINEFIKPLGIVPGNHLKEDAFKQGELVVLRIEAIMSCFLGTSFKLNPNPSTINKSEMLKSLQLKIYTPILTAIESTYNLKNSLAILDHVKIINVVYTAYLLRVDREEFLPKIHNLLKYSHVVFKGNSSSRDDVTTMYCYDMNNTIIYSNSTAGIGANKRAGLLIGFVEDFSVSQDGVIQIPPRYMKDFFNPGNDVRKLTKLIADLSGNSFDVSRMDNLTSAYYYDGIGHYKLRNEESRMYTDYRISEGCDRRRALLDVISMLSDVGLMNTQNYSAREMNAYKEFLVHMQSYEDMIHTIYKVQYPPSSKGAMTEKDGEDIYNMYLTLFELKKFKGEHVPLWVLLDSDVKITGKKNISIPKILKLYNEMVEHDGLVDEIVRKRDWYDHMQGNYAENLQFTSMSDSVNGRLVYMGSNPMLRYVLSLFKNLYIINVTSSRAGFINHRTGAYHYQERDSNEVVYILHEDLRNYPETVGNFNLEAGDLRYKDEFGIKDDPRKYPDHVGEFNLYTYGNRVKKYYNGKPPVDDIFRSTVRSARDNTINYKAIEGAVKDVFESDLNHRIAVFEVADMMQQINVVRSLSTLGGIYLYVDVEPSSDLLNFVCMDTCYSLIKTINPVISSIPFTLPSMRDNFMYNDIVARSKTPIVQNTFTGYLDEIEHGKFLYPEGIVKFSPWWGASVKSRLQIPRAASIKAYDIKEYSDVTCYLQNVISPFAYVELDYKFYQVHETYFINVKYTRDSKGKIISESAKIVADSPDDKIRLTYEGQPDIELDFHDMILERIENTKTITTESGKSSRIHYTIHVPNYVTIKPIHPDLAQTYNRAVGDTFIYSVVERDYLTEDYPDNSYDSALEVRILNTYATAHDEDRVIQMLESINFMQANVYGATPLRRITEPFSYKAYRASYKEFTQ